VKAGEAVAVAAAISAVSPLQCVVQLLLRVTAVAATMTWAKIPKAMAARHPGAMKKSRFDFSWQK
jgi:hypothetical protein